MRHVSDTKMRFQLRPVSHLYPYPDTISAHAVVHSETKPRHHVSPHTPPSIPLPGQAEPILRRHKCHRHQLRKRKNSRFVCQPLTKAKLTRSCAGPNPDAITYTQFTTDIALQETEICKILALEHHKSHKMRTSMARNAGCHAKTSGKAARDLSRGSIEPDPDQVRG